MNDQDRIKQSEDFIKRLIARHPEAAAEYGRLLEKKDAGADYTAAFELPGVLGPISAPRLKERIAGLRAPESVPLKPWAMTLESIILRERPILSVKDGLPTKDGAYLRGVEGMRLADRIMDASGVLGKVLPMVGRINVANFPGGQVSFLGTGWFVDRDIVVTNRHVAEYMARPDGRTFRFLMGSDRLPLSSSWSSAHESEEEAVDESRVFAIGEVLYIEPDGNLADIAFLRVKRPLPPELPPGIPIARADAERGTEVCVIGYPAKAEWADIPDQEMMREMYGGRYDIKRVAPGLVGETQDFTTSYDCSTLGGNSGSPVLDLATGEAVGLHHTGQYLTANYGVSASMLSQYVGKKRWNTPYEITTGGSDGRRTTNVRTPRETVTTSTVQADVSPATPGAVTVTIPLVVSVTLGTPVPGTAISVGITAGGVGGVGGAGGNAAAAPDAEAVEKAAAAFWSRRPAGVIAVRVGYQDADDRIGEVPCIAASVAPADWAAIAKGAPAAFQGIPIRYLPADVAEQVEALPLAEVSSTIAYDDEARKTGDFSLEAIEEEMTVTLHVGPEYAWDVLRDFLGGTRRSLVSSMYEFFAGTIKDAIQTQLEEGASFKLVVDNMTFRKLKERSDEEEQGFDRVAVFGAWAEDFKFQRIVAPEGMNGLISDSYHMKVTVRDGDAFWLSSGNWKSTSSQPVITEEQREQARAGKADLPGNRDWHIVVANPTLAERLKKHIEQDFIRSEELGGRELPKSRLKEAAGIYIDVPVPEAAVLEARKPPNEVIAPETFTDTIRVRPLLTPDRKGAVYSDAVLKLIRSARKSLWFQIPYISMPSNPGVGRGYIDELIEALAERLAALDDARLLLRGGGSAGKGVSSPLHTAWYLKSKGVDVDNKVGVIEDHHTKGMIVDGRRVLIGSHNWSLTGVTLNRDASLLFDNQRVADYYARAFQVDWDRSGYVRPERYVKPPKEVREAVAGLPPQGYERILLSDWIKDGGD